MQESASREPAGAPPFHPFTCLPVSLVCGREPRGQKFTGLPSRVHILRTTEVRQCRGLSLAYPRA